MKWLFQKLEQNQTDEIKRDTDGDDPGFKLDTRMSQSDQAELAFIEQNRATLDRDSVERIAACLDCWRREVWEAAVNFFATRLVAARKELSKENSIELERLELDTDVLREVSQGPKGFGADRAAQLLVPITKLFGNSHGTPTTSDGSTSPYWQRIEAYNREQAAERERLGHSPRVHSYSLRGASIWDHVDSEILGELVELGLYAIVESLSDD